MVEKRGRREEKWRGGMKKKRGGERRRERDGGGDREFSFFSFPALSNHNHFCFSEGRLVYRGGGGGRRKTARRGEERVRSRVFLVGWGRREKNKMQNFEHN